MVEDDRGERRRPAEVAAVMFAQVSNEFPASVCFQATRIAQVCTDRKLDPRSLGSALHADQKLITGLTTTANTLHKARGAKNAKGEPLVVSEADIREIVNSDFSVAVEMGRIPEAEQNKFLALYSAFRQTADLIGVTRAEDAFRVVADALVQKHTAPTIIERPSGLTVVTFGEQA